MNILTQPIFGLFTPYILLKNTLVFKKTNKKAINTVKI